MQMHVHETGHDDTSAGIEPRNAGMARRKRRRGRGIRNVSDNALVNPHRPAVDDARVGAERDDRSASNEEVGAHDCQRTRTTRATVDSPPASRRRK